MRARALVGWNLRCLRVAKDLSQEALGLLAECEPRDIERGRENPTVETLEALADVLGTHIAVFFVVPEPGAERPTTLRRGRKPKTGLARAEGR